MDLSIIIINWNSVGFLRKCLKSVYENTSGVSFEVVVLDNASYDGCAEVLAGEFSSVRFIQSDVNLGFAAGNNVAVQHASGKALLFLNSDTEVIGSAITEMFHCLQRLPDGGVLGPKLLNSDGTIQDTCLQAFPTIANELVDSRYLRRRFPTWSVWGNHVLFEEYHSPVRVQGIVGACMLIWRDLFDAVGGFDTTYFMYAEDMDLCYRLQRLGKSNYYIGTAVVTHHGGQSSNTQADRQLAAVIMRESQMRFMQAHRGTMYARSYQVTTAIAALCRMAAVGMLMLFADGIPRRAHALSLAKWRRVFRWALGSESPLQRPTPAAGNREAAGGRLTA